MLTDIWAHRFSEDPKLLNDVEDEDFDPDDVAAQIGANHAVQNDPVGDDWEDMTP